MENLPLQNEQNKFGHLMSKFKFKLKKTNFYISGVVIFLAFFYFFFLSAPKDFPVGKIINIKENSSLRYISKYFKENNIIRSRVVFETFVIIFGGEKYIASGDYFFENKISVFEVAKRISKAERNLAPVRVTIPEGFNISEIAKVFNLKLPNFNQNIFLLEAKEKEGYLFPDTYFFLTTDSEEDVLDAMSDNFEKKINLIKSEIVFSGKTEKEIIIMASLIEEESKGDIDREYISGILWKRLAKGMPLQVDAAPETYKTKGLPKNPISNPGIEAIKAAIYPKISNYFYYLHDADGNIHYASTFEEHKINKQKYLK